MDYSKLSDRELDALVAEKVMGRSVLHAGSQSHGGPPEHLYLPLPGNIVERYSTDDNAARLMRDRIAELVLQHKFCNLIWEIQTAEEPNFEADNIPYEWFLIHASPRQQAIAALQAHDAAKENAHE